MTSATDRDAANASSWASDERTAVSEALLGLVVGAADRIAADLVRTESTREAVWCIDGITVLFGSGMRTNGDEQDYYEVHFGRDSGGEVLDLEVVKSFGDEPFTKIYDYESDLGGSVGVDSDERCVAPALPSGLDEEWVLTHFPLRKVDQVDPITGAHVYYEITEKALCNCTQDDPTLPVNHR